MTAVTITFLILGFLLWKTTIVVPMRQQRVKERLGKFAGIMKPGLHILIPFVDRAAYTLEVREQVLDVPPQMCITRDNIQVEVDGLVYLKVIDAQLASYGIEDYRRAAVNLAQTTMRSELGKLTLHSSFSERDTLNETIVKEIDKASASWGIKVLRYEISNISPSEHVIHTLEKAMEAERARRADVTQATAHKEATIAVSEGQRQESINRSEGEKQSRLNRAQGQATEIRLLANAQSQGLIQIAEALQSEGGDQAMQMRIVEKFISEFEEILGNAEVTVVPAELANIKAFFEGVSRTGSAMSSVPTGMTKGTTDGSI
jgi:regulator of protease activity HflC (stomatin/prohibitin superfamily)